MANIKLFTKSGCPYCDAKRREFIKNGIEFVEIDVHSSKEAAIEALSYSGGNRMVPIIVTDGVVSVAPNGG